MKKGIYLAVFIFIASLTQVAAQGFHLGVKGGANLSKLSGRSFSDGFQWGYVVGGFAELNVTSKWGIQPEVLFSQTNSKTSTEFSSIIPSGLNDVDVQLNYLSIPILLTYKPIPILSLQLGPQFGILLNPNETVTGSAKNAFKSGDFSLVGGAQVNILMLKVGARYILGLTNINDISNADSWKTQNFQIYVGLRIF